MVSKWANSSLKDKVARVALSGLFSVPVVCAVKYGFYTIASLIDGSPKPELIDDVLATPDTYLISGGVVALNIIPDIILGDRNIGYSCANLYNQVESDLKWKCKSQDYKVDAVWYAKRNKGKKELHVLYPVSKDKKDKGYIADENAVEFIVTQNSMPEAKKSAQRGKHVKSYTGTSEIGEDTTYRISSFIKQKGNLLQRLNVRNM